MPTPASLAGFPVIPAMTTDAERECFYRLAREAHPDGEIVELGAWLGASTAYIAAALRDRGDARKVQVYDKFQSKPGHRTKVKAFYAKRGLTDDKMPLGDAMAQVKRNLGSFLDNVELHRCQIEGVKWGDAPITVLITDAPKRVPAIAAVMTNFRKGIGAGTVMAWQDFCHFPSYEIPACLYRLRNRLEFVEAVVPGTTLVFKVLSQWDAKEVSVDALSLERWTPNEIEAAWKFWLDGFVPPEKSPIFRCGEAMFLCDIGHEAQGREVLASVLRDDADAVLPKWYYLRDSRPDFRSRYRVLFECLKSHGALEPC